MRKGTHISTDLRYTSYRKQKQKKPKNRWFLLKQHQVAIWTLSMNFQCLFKAVKLKKNYNNNNNNKEKRRGVGRKKKGMALQHLVFTAGKWLICIMYTSF